MFKGVLFDMDGLLLDSERLSVACFNETTEAFGLPDMNQIALACIGTRADATAQRIERALNGAVPISDFLEEWSVRFRRHMALDIPLKPGAVELLTALNNAGISCAVATSTQTNSALKHLKTAGLFEYFKTVTGGEMVTNGKPAPDIYHAAALSIGLRADQCAAFEDSDPGTMAAVASGATTVQVPDINPAGDAVKQLGHEIADNLLDGARRIGLIN